MTHNTTKSTLSAYPPASLRELWHVALPLMLTTLSSALMQFLDRIILSHYSLEVMNASAAISMTCLVPIFGFVALTSIAEVFVGKSYGAKQHQRVAQAVWQMLWFGLATYLLFLPLIFFAGPWLIPDTYQPFGNHFYQVTLFFGPFPALIAAISSFYVGRAKTRFVLLSTVISNLTNFVLDLMLIFGVSNWIPSFGLDGAAYATGAALSLQFLILFGGFLRKKNRLQFATGNHRLHWKSFKQCVLVGAPNAIGHSIEFAAWATILHLMSAISQAHISVFAIGQSIFTLLVFLTDGLQKAITAIAANFIGAEQESMLIRLFKSSFKLHVIIVLALVFPLLIRPDFFIDHFLSAEVDPVAIQRYAIISCFWVWTYYIFDGFVWITAGFLTAYEDTFFIMMTNALTAWFVAVLPFYLIYTTLDIAPGHSWIAMVGYSIINLICFLLRVRYQYLKRSVTASQTLH